jgi:regulatory protein
MKVGELECRNKAMNLLARREHGFIELVDKLGVKGFEKSLSTEVVSRLRTEGLQSDERFIEMFMRVRISNGSGPIKIMYELKSKGIEEDLIHKFSIKDSDRWISLGKDVLDKKFKNISLQTKESWIKAARFLEQRGFSSEQVRLIIKSRDI